jgi:hypothetical protein
MTGADTRVSGAHQVGHWCVCWQQHARTRVVSRRGVKVTLGDEAVACGLVLRCAPGVLCAALCVGGLVCVHS